MSFETAFSLAGLTAMAGWLLLLGSPRLPVLSDRIAGTVLPALLSLGYLVLILMPNSPTGGFQTLSQVMQLFTNEQAALAGWVHFLAFDLVIGAWACRTARAEGIAFPWVLPCLPLIFLIGPVGYLCFLTVRALRGQPRPA